MVTGNKMNIKELSSTGFTLIETMITLLMSALIMATIYSSYLAQQKNFNTQDSITEMQQNLRASQIYLTKDIREAGCDPTGLANTGFISATAGELHFTRDILGNPVNKNQADGIISTNTEEHVTFGFSPTYDADRNGIADGGGVDWSASGELGKDNGNGFQSIADGIDAIEFNYILDDGTSTLTPSNGQLNNIVGVQVSILARSSRADRNYTNNDVYITAAGTVWNPPNDNFRRHLAITTIQCRNQFY